MTSRPSQATVDHWSGPAEVLPEIRHSELYRPDELDDEYDYHGFEVLDFPDPVVHGVGINATLNDVPDGVDGHVSRDLDTVYRRLFQGWQQHVGDREEEPCVLIEDAHELFDWMHDEYRAHLCLKSKGWKVGTGTRDGNTVGTRYEYSLQMIRVDDDGNLEPKKPLPTNFQTWVRPQERGLVYKSGDELKLPYGTGTKFHTQTTYSPPVHALNRTMVVVTAALDVLGQDRPDWSDLHYDSLKIWKGEVHHRFGKKHMGPACETLAEAKRLINYGGGSEMETYSKRAESGRVEELVRSNRWDMLGFVQPDGFELGAKCYRSSNWTSYQEDTYKHPKMEAYLAGTDRDQELPHIDEWPSLRAMLRQLATGLLVRSGVPMHDLEKDDYYEAYEADRVDVPIPMGWRTKLREANEEREHQLRKMTMGSLSAARWDILYTVAMYAGQGVTYEQLQEITGFSYDYVRELVDEMEEMEILTRLTMPRVIVYWSEELRVNAIEALEDIRPDEGMGEIRARGDRRRNERQAERERREREEEEADRQLDDQADDVDRDQDGVDDVADRDDREHQAEDLDVFGRGLWKPFDEIDVLSPEELRNALEREFINGNHVAVRVDRYDWLD